MWYMYLHETLYMYILSSFKGPILNFPVINVDVIIHNADLSFDASPNVVGAAVSKCIYSALKRAMLHILEPIINLEVCLDDLY